MKAVDSMLARRLDDVRPGQSLATDSVVGSLPEPVRSKTAPLPARRQPPTSPKRNAVVTYRAFVPGASSRLREFGKWISFLVAVILPTVIGGVYYAFIASPQYVSEFRFSVRPNLGSGSAASAAVDVALAMSNSYIVSDYVSSRDAVASLEEKVGLSSLYSAESIDFLSRLNPQASMEKVLDYWDSRIHTSYDMTTGINIIEVSAFSPEAAHRIAVALKELCERLVNQISDNARKSQMDFALSELERSEARLKDVRRQETELRTDQRTIDARKEADGRLQLNIKLRGELAALESQYSSLSQYMDSKSPKLNVLKNEIAATREQIGLLQAQVGENGTGVENNAVSANAITRYDQIQTDLEIASKLYESSLTNYESARAQANNSQIYLATYVQPNTPQAASYPRVFFDTILVFLSACGIWIVLTLIYYSIRDHA
jgi:capsular polysaccharide transport system permease protein